MRARMATRSFRGTQARGGEVCPIAAAAVTPTQASDRERRGRRIRRPVQNPSVRTRSFEAAAFCAAGGDRPELSLHKTRSNQHSAMCDAVVTV